MEVSSNQILLYVQMLFAMYFSSIFLATFVPGFAQCVHLILMDDLLYIAFEAIFNTSFKKSYNFSEFNP